MGGLSNSSFHHLPVVLAGGRAVAKGMAILTDLMMSEEEGKVVDDEMVGGDDGQGEEQSL